MEQHHGKKKIVQSIILFCMLTLGLAFSGPILGGSPENMGPGFLLWGLAPLFVALLLRIMTKDWADVGIRPLIRKNWLWYIISILAFPAITLLTFLLGELLSVSSFSSFAFAPFLKSFLSALPIFIVFAIFEEFGWRGYMVPKLAALRINIFGVYAIVALVWATWHLPYLRELAWVYSAEELITFIPRFYLAMFAYAIFYGEMRLVTGSIWPAILMHGVMNAFGHPLAADYVQIAQGNEFLVSSTGLYSIFLAGLIGVGINRYRVGKEKCTLQ